MENTYVLLLLTQARETAIFVLNRFQMLINLEDTSERKNNETRSQKWYDSIQICLGNHVEVLVWILRQVFVIFDDNV